MSKVTAYSIVPLLFSANLWGQSPENLDSWLRSRIESKITASRAATDRMLVEANSNRAIRQKDAPSGDSRSTSLVDESAASDFVNFALALAPATTGASPPPGGSGSGVFAASAYSLLALFNRTSLTDPEFYKAHTAARQLSFTLGSSASELARDNTDQAGTVFGFKYTLLNNREIYSRTNQKLLADLQSRFSTVTAVETKVKFRIQMLLFCAAHPAGITGVAPEDWAGFCADPTGAPPAGVAPALAKFFGALANPAETAAILKRTPEETMKKADALIDANLETFASLRDMINSTYDQIKQGRQLALTVTYVNRPELGTDDFRSALVFDYGLSPRLNWTVNGSFDHRDRKTSFDTRGGRFATEFLGRLTGYSEDLWGRQPITLAFAGEGKWLTRQKPQYSVQAKLTVPITAGLDLPIVYRWAKRIDLVDKSGKELKLGITVDLGGLSQFLKGR